MSELKPCPFCGGTEIRGPEYAAPDHWIECERCEIIITSRERKSAIKLWNRRPIEDALRAELECMKEQETLIAVEATKLRALCRDMYEMLSETYTGRKLLANAHDGPELFDKRYRGVMGDE